MNYLLLITSSILASDNNANPNLSLDDVVQKCPLELAPNKTCWDLFKSFAQSLSDSLTVEIDDRIYRVAPRD